ncbi:MAG: hypothetical protein JWN31_1073 [Frankiales bacterium]|nr:hypothetical protein [Frankiales bacterium]
MSALHLATPLLSSDLPTYLADDKKYLWVILGISLVALAFAGFCAR